MAISAGQVFVDLGARLDRKEFEAYERELKRVQERTAKREHFRAELGANFDSRAFNAYERELKRAESQNDHMIRSNGRLRTSFGNVWTKGGAAFAAAGGAFAVVTAVKSVTKAYGESQVSQEKMRAQLKALGIDYDAHAKQIDQVIQKTSQLSGLDDEDLQDAFTAVVRSTKSVNTGLKDMSLVADLARAKHMDVAKAGQLVARVHAGNVRALKSLGIEFTASTRHVDELKRSNDKYTPAQLAAAKAADKHADSTRALGLLQDRLKGQAEAYGKTQAGSMDRVKVAFENLQETVGKRLGPFLTRAANGLANFINEMGNGTGKGGRFVDVLQAVGRGFTLFARGVRTTTGIVAGFFSGILRGFQAFGEAGQHLPGVGDKFRKFAQDADRAADRIDGFRKKLKISVEAGQVRDDLERMRRKTGSSISDMHDTVISGLRTIRRRLGTDTDEGQKAVHAHFRSMVARIREAMRDGKVETADGMAEIRKIMLTELKELGIPSALAKGKPLSSTPPKGGNVPVQKAGGGWIGAPGTIGYDTVPAMLAPGEAVLNRHQQAVIEGMLGDGFLDRLFATVDRPHYLARGGRARFARGGDTGGRFLQLPESISPTHQTAGLAGYPAQDIFASPGTSVGAPVSGVIARLSGQAGGPGGGGAYGYSIYENGSNNRSYFLTHFGSTSVRPGQHVNRGDIIGTVADYPGGVPDHIHEGVHGGLTGITAGGPSGATLVAKAWDAIKAPQTTMGGLLGRVVQGTLDRATSAANRRGRSLAAAASTDPGGSGVVGPVTGSGDPATIRAALRLAGQPASAANVRAIQILMGKESGGSATAVNPTAVGSEHATGIMQMLPSTFRQYAVSGHGNILSPLDNIAASVRYQMARYGHLVTQSPYARGGFIQRFARGGKARPAAKKKPPKPELSTKENRGITRSIARGEKGIVSYEADIQQMEREYGQMDRRFGITDEVLLIEQPDGSVTVDEGALGQRLGELDKLIQKRKQIENTIRAYRRAVGRLIKTIREAVHRLTKALHAAKGKARQKERGGYRTAINSYEERLGELRPIHQTLGGDIEDARIDLLELRSERREVAGTTGSAAPPADTGLDTGADTGGDTGAADTTTTEAPPTPLQIAEGAAAEMRTFLAGRQELLTSFGRNFVPQSAAAGTFGTPDALTAAAGLRAFGGATAGGLGGATIIANFASAPDNAPTFVQQIRFIAEG